MIAHGAIRVDTTQPGARVGAFAVDARQVRCTVRVDDTLGPAVGRAADHFRQAGALTTVPDNTGRVGVGSAWVRVARIIGDDRQYS